MISTIDQINLKNSFYNSICPWQDKSKDQITREDKEHLFPPQRKGWDQPFTAEDIFENPTEEDKKLFDKDWVCKIISGEKPIKEYEDHLIHKGFSNKQVGEITSSALENTERQKDWAEYNEKNGKIASHLMDGAIALGVACKLLDSESVPKALRTTVDLAHGTALGVRANYQGSIYNRFDDDASKNRFEAEMYGGEAVGKLANGAMTVETKVRFWAQPLVELLPEPFKSIGRMMLPLFSAAWWRGRMAAAINHEFLTDLLRFMQHKPLSLFRRKKSIEVLEGIKERKNLDISYIKERHYKNAGLNEKKDQKINKLIPQIAKLFSNILSKKVDLAVRKDSASKLSNTIAPALGLHAFFAVIIGSIASSILKIFDKQNRFIDFYFSSNVLSQQGIYLFRLVTPIKFEAEELKKQLNDSDFVNGLTKKEIKDRKDLYRKKTNLLHLGLGCFFVNALNTFLKLKNFENPLLKKGADILDEVANDLILKFFSYRRHLKGYEFEIMNPEYYTNENEQNTENIETQKDVNVARVQ